MKNCEERMREYVDVDPVMNRHPIALGLAMVADAIREHGRERVACNGCGHELDKDERNTNSCNVCGLGT